MTGEAKPATFWDGVILLLLNLKAHNHGIDVQPILQRTGPAIANVLAISIYCLTTVLRFRFGPL